jgi:hypothetical protein
MREVEVSGGQRLPPYSADKCGEQHHVDVQIVSVLQIQAGISDACAAIKLQRESRKGTGIARSTHRFLFLLPWHRPSRWVWLCGARTPFVASGFHSQDVNGRLITRPPARLRG